jgi:thiol:disulfide interchange protein DsbG
MNSARLRPLALAFSLALPLSCFTTPAFAGMPATASAPAAVTSAPAKAVAVPAAVAAAVQKISNGQAVIKHAFAAPIGLIGMAVNLGGGRNMILYSTPDGKYMVMGGIFGPNGENYTMDAAKKYLPPPPPPPNVANNFSALKDTQTFLWGNPAAKKEVWMIADPDCIFCHKMFKGFEPFVKDGSVKIHVIMVGFLKPDSLGKAAAIFSAKNPADALVNDETKFDVATEEGGIKPDLKNQKAVAAIKANNAWMSGHGIGGTPYILYRNKEGAPAALPGFSADVKGFLEGVK